jgi:hypothetical protein
MWNARYLLALGLIKMYRVVLLSLEMLQRCLSSWLTYNIIPSRFIGALHTDLKHGYRC